MERKKFSSKEGTDNSLFQFRERRKWQIALRRYVLEQNKSSYYSPFFGLDIEKFREWLERQFDENLNWLNFSKAWQFDHIVPVAYFDFRNKEEMRLCWNFTNIRIERTDLDKHRSSRIDVLAAKAYFNHLYARTGYIICKKMTEKIMQIETAQVSTNTETETFIIENKSYLDKLLSFTSYEFDKLNTGTPLESVLFEVNFLKKIGSHL